MPVTGNRKERTEQTVFVLVEDLHDMPAGIRIGHLENIGTGGQRLSWHFDGGSECEHRFLVPFVGVGFRQHSYGREAG
jgi:hypothetical protein